MATERNSSDNPVNPEILRAERFLDGVYNDVSTWLQETRGAQVLRMFESESIRDWETQTTFPPSTITLGMDLEKAIVLKDERNTYGLVLGKRPQSKYDRDGGPGLQFGFLSSDYWIRNRPLRNTDIDKLNLLVGPSPFHNSRAEFYYRSDLNKLSVDCWINSSLYGGRDIGRWDKSAINPEGHEAVVSTVKRLVRNFDPV